MQEETQNPIELINTLAGLHTQIHETLQNPFFDSFAIAKKRRLQDKLASGLFNELNSIYLGSHLFKCTPLQSRRTFQPLPEHFLSLPPETFAAGSVLLITNNDLGGNINGFMAFYNSRPDLLIIAWDWDMQHWIQMSALLGMHCDIYVPSGSENAFLLTHFNPGYIGPIFAGVHQWSRRFIAENMSVLLQPRKDEPYGPHAFYGKYQRRNRAIATVAQTFPSVNFVNNDYRGKTDLENLQDWGGYKTHWIAPVLGGVPIRVYNALALGGIPIVPTFYRNMPEVALLGDIPLYYDVADMLDPRAINAQAVAKFDRAGESGLIERIAFGLQTLHIDHRCEQILAATEHYLQRTRSGDYDYDQSYAGLRP